VQILFLHSSFASFNLRDNSNMSLIRLQKESAKTDEHEGTPAVGSDGGIERQAGHPANASRREDSSWIMVARIHSGAAAAASCCLLAMRKRLLRPLTPGDVQERHGPAPTHIPSCGLDTPSIQLELGPARTQISSSE